MDDLTGIRRYDYNDFDVSDLRERKARRGLKIAIGLPTHNEEKNLGNTIFQIERHGLSQGIVDAVAVFDSSSTDDTEGVAREYNTPFVRDTDIATKLGLANEHWRPGKGFNLWASLEHFKNYDGIFWLDSDLNIKPEYLTGLIGAYLMNEGVRFVKGNYFRPETDNRVYRFMTEPIFGMFFQEEAVFADPLCGLFGGDVNFFRSLPFFSGYGVEVATSIYGVNKAQPDQIAEVNLGTLENREHSNLYMGRMSASIFSTLLDIANHLGRIDLKTKLPPYITQVINNGPTVQLEKFEDYQDLRLPPHTEAIRV